MTTETLDYEAQRLQNIKDNQALLFSLGLADSSAPAKLYVPKKVQAPKKKRLRDEAIYEPAKDELDVKSDDAEEVNALKKKKGSITSPEMTGTDGSPLRRSRRSIHSIKRFKDETYVDESGVEFVVVDDEDKRVRRTGGEPQRVAKSLGVRTQNPKQFGHIPGVEVGRTWASRIQCSTDAIHAPTVAGISGNATEGAWSIALSGGYPDDVDLGVAFTYTGCGGRDLKGTKQNPKNLRTAEQTSDQSFDWPLNAALKRSAETKKPIRVIRGFKLPSPYAPAEGYRYDGLYIVRKAWMGKGLTKGLKVCRYAFKRMDGQPELPVREAEDLEAGDA